MHRSCCCCCSLLLSFCLFFANVSSFGLSSTSSKPPPHYSQQFPDRNPHHRILPYCSLSPPALLLGRTDETHQNNDNNNTTRVPFATISTIPPQPLVLQAEVDQSEYDESEDDEEETISETVGNFRERVAALQLDIGSDYIRIINDDDDEDELSLLENVPVPVNSVVFQIISNSTANNINNDTHTSNNNNEYALVILASQDRVNVSALTKALRKHAAFDDNTNLMNVVLAPRSTVESICGFRPGCIPPLFLLSSDDDNGEQPAPTPPILTIVDETLVTPVSNDGDSGGYDEESTLR